MYAKRREHPSAVPILNGGDDSSGLAQSETPSPAEGNVLTQPPIDERRKLEHFPEGGRTRVRNLRKRGITDEPQGSEARIETETLAREDLERPHRPVVDRPLRRAESPDRLDARSCQGRRALIEIRGKRQRGQLVDGRVPVPVRGDLVAGRCNFLDEAGV